MNIVEFWRRWHITLSRFLRDYLYITLGGNRKGKVRRYIILFLTMLLGGLWHGAGWPFVVWGSLHGVYLMINHAWNRLLTAVGLNPNSSFAYRMCSWLITFVAVVAAWVYFRAPTLEQGNAIFAALLGANGAEIPSGIMVRLGNTANALHSIGIGTGQGSGKLFVTNYLWVIIAGSSALFLPNVAQIFHRHDPVLFEHSGSFRSYLGQSLFRWKKPVRWATAISAMSLLGILTLTQVSEFLYFQF